MRTRTITLVLVCCAMPMMHGCPSSDVPVSDPDPTPAAHQSPPVTDQVVPGVSLGPVQIGDTWSQVTAAMGAPSEIWASYATWTNFAEFEGTGISVAFDDLDSDEAIDKFEAVHGAFGWSPFSGTYSGIGIGSPATQIVQVMGAPEEADSSGYWYWSRGILWGLSNGVSDHIYVFTPHQSSAASGSLAKPLVGGTQEEFEQLHKLRAEAARSQHPAQ